MKRKKQWQERSKKRFSIHSKIYIIAIREIQQKFIRVASNIPFGMNEKGKAHKRQIAFNKNKIQLW